MALETLKNVGEINGERIVDMNGLAKQYPEHFNSESGQMNWEWFEKEIRPNHFIYVRHDKNSLTFNIQNGPIKENGKNGCQVTDMIAVARHMISELNILYPCAENDHTLGYLDAALASQVARTVRRTELEIEGRSLEEPHGGLSIL